MFKVRTLTHSKSLLFLLRSCLNVTFPICESLKKKKQLTFPDAFERLCSSYKAKLIQQEYDYKTFHCMSETY